MSRILLHVSAFLLTLVACVWATVALSRGPIERDLAERSLEALSSIEGFRPDFCQVAFVGRDGQVSGEVQSQALKDEAERRLQDLYGARVIETQLVVRPFDAPWIMVERDTVKGKDGLRVAGLMSGETERDAFAAELREAIGDKAAIDLQVEVREKVNPAPWLSRMVAVAGKLVTQAKGASAELRDGKLSLSGEMPDGGAQDAFAVLAERQFDGSGIALQFALTVAPPPEPSRFEMFPPDGKQVVVAGRLADLDSAQRLLSLVRGHGGDWTIKDQIVVAENTTPAPWIEALALLLPSVLSEVSGAGVRLEGSMLRLDGQISEDMFEAIGSVAEQNFPAAEFEVQNRLRVMTPPREAMVIVVISPDGPVRLKGLLANTELKGRVIEAVKAALGGGELELLTDELQVDPNVLEATWIDALVGLIPPYIKQVKRGGLTINSNVLVANAVINSDADRDLIWAMTEQFFPDESYRRHLELQFPEEIESRLARDIEPPEGD